MVKVEQLPILLIKRGVNVEQKNDVQATASLLRTEQQRKGSKRIRGNGQSHKRNSKAKNIIISI
jgi:hypothetical protein